MISRPKASRLVVGVWLRSLTGHYVAMQEGNKLFKVECTGCIEAGNKPESFPPTGGKLRAVDDQKDISRSESGSLVAIEKSMILRKALPERSCLFYQSNLISRLGTIQRGCQQAVVAYAGNPAIAAYLIRMNSEEFGQRQVVGHSASFL
jgi:hypothetical protein